jgi:nicotinamidase-related amidase
LLITGITTEVCVQSTLREAVDRGFRCITVENACASAYPELHRAAMQMIGVEGGILGEVRSTEEVLGQLAPGENMP